MKRLTTRTYWDKCAYSVTNVSSVKLLPKNFYTVHLHKILSRYCKPKASILELGVAPGVQLIQIAKEFGLDPYGVDYSAIGVNQTRKNFSAAGYNPRHVYTADIFDSKFVEKHKNKYDIVFSAGLVEHFDDPKKIFAIHAQLVKPGGVLIITVPNFKYTGFIMPKDILAVHNLAIMSPQMLRKAMPPNMNVEEANYFGGLFNIGLYQTKNRLLEYLRLGAYLIQRLTVDQLQRLLLLLGVTLRWKRTTPSIYVVARKQ